MPWVIKKNGAKWLVYKEGQDGEPTGQALGTHDSEAEAKNQLAALYASERKAVKFVEGSDDLIEGLLMPYGGVHNGRDLDGQFFSKRTDFCLDWFPADRPQLYNHGLDEDAGVSVVGRIKGIELRDDGGWMRSQLDKQAKYFSAISQLVKAGKLYLSSGAMAHLVKIDSKTGEILRWPLVEGSLTPTPANLLATVGMPEVAKHYKAADLDPDALKASLDAAADAQPADAEPQPEPTKAVGLSELKAMAGSFEELQEKLNAAINPRNPFASSDRYAYIQATFPGYFIAELHELGEKKTYRVDYSLDDEGKVSLGKMTEVEQTFKPLAKSASLVPEQLAAHTELVTAYALALSRRTKDLAERRIKESRTLSAATISRMDKCLTAIETAAGEMRAFMDSANPAKVEAKADLERLAIDMDLLEMEAALLATA